jgi:hypothetical protein
LAKYAIRTGTVPRLTIPASDLGTGFAERCWKKWEELWTVTSQSKGKKYYEINLNIRREKKKPWFHESETYPGIKSRQSADSEARTAALPH